MDRVPDQTNATDAASVDDGAQAGARSNFLVRFAQHGTQGLSSRDAERGRRFNMLFGALVVLLALGLLGGALDESTRLYMVAIPIVCWLAMIPLYVWTSADFSHRFRTGSHLLVALLLIADATGPAVFNGGIDSGVMIYFALIPLFAALLFFELRPTLVWIVITFCAAIAVAVAGAAIGNAPDPPPDTEERISGLIGVVALFAILVGATSLTISRYRLRETEAAKAAEEQAHLEAVRTRDAISRFLATMSHEMRTPMNVVLGLAEVLQNSALEPDQAQAVETIRRQSATLVALMNDVLDLSKLDTGMMAIEHTTFDLRDLLRDAVSAFAEQAISKGVEFELRMSADVPERVASDPLRLRQVLANLVANAVKFTQAGRIAVEVTIVGHGSDVGTGNPTLRVRVSDTGIGISEADRERLFEAFQQADSSTTRRFGGTGLGLAISRTLVERMNGKIGVDSEPGTGSTFWFEVPVEAARDASAPEHTLEAAATTVDDMLSGRHILLAEDDPENRALGELFLSMLGCEVVSVADGEQAVAQCTRADFDAVLMDVEMPQVDGYEATRRIRTQVDANGHLPIIALTAGALASDRARCLDAGMDAVLNKPYTVEDLGNAVSKQLTRRRNI